MKKILATLAGVSLVAGIGLAANSVVDTQETKSIAPVVDTTTAPALSSDFADRTGRTSRSTTRPVKPVVPKPVVPKKPKPTKVVKVIKKKPVVKKTVKKTKYVSSRSHNAPGGIAACIRKYESDGNYRAQNPTTSASGAYQFVDGTWHAVTGLPGHAKDYSPATQDAAFYKLWNGGKGAHHWVTAHKCGW